MSTLRAIGRRGTATVGGRHTGSRNSRWTGRPTLRAILIPTAALRPAFLRPTLLLPFFLSMAPS